MFVQVASEGGERLQERKEAVIKVGKYSCGLYIINEVLIRFDTDHT